MTDLSGSYEMVSSEGYDEYLKEIGEGMVSRKLASSAKPTIHIVDKTDGMTLTDVTTFGTLITDFTYGVPTKTMTRGGQLRNSLFTLDANTVTEVSRLDGLSAEITRYFTPEGLTITYQAGGVMATRKFKFLRG